MRVLAGLSSVDTVILQSAFQNNDNQLSPMPPSSSCAAIDE
jgi:hypothetical protein